jgi:uncharacterized protein
VVGASELILRDRTSSGLIAAIAILAAYNLVGNLVIPGWAYVPTNLAMALVLLAVARWVGLGWVEIGLSASTARRGLAYGSVAALTVAAVLVAGSLLPDTRELYEDARVQVGIGGLIMQVAVSIPLGTVVLEELAFRGVLLALLLRRFTTRSAVASSSALFGLWHIVPTIPAASGNRVITDTAASSLGMTTLVLAAVVATALAGVIFCWLRLRSGSLLAPVLTHVATNSGSFTIGWVVTGGT